MHLIFVMMNGKKQEVFAMLFYEFKLECKYAGEATLEKAFAESRREGWSAVANVNDALCEENDEERYRQRCAMRPVRNGTGGSARRGGTDSLKERYEVLKQKNPQGECLADFLLCAGIACWRIRWRPGRFLYGQNFAFFLACFFVLFCGIIKCFARCIYRMTRTRFHIRQNE